MAMFVAVIATAFVLDVYFGNNQQELEKIQAQSEEQSNEAGKVYLVAQTAPGTVKTSEQKTSTRTPQLQSHDKFLRKYYSNRNYQVLKAEVVTQTTPLISSYHYLVFQNHFVSPEEDPLA